MAWLAAFGIQARMKAMKFGDKGTLRQQTKKRSEVHSERFLWRSERDLNPRAAFDRLLP